MGAGFYKDPFGMLWLDMRILEAMAADGSTW